VGAVVGGRGLWYGRARFGFVGAVVSTDAARSRAWSRARTMALSGARSGAQLRISANLLCLTFRGH
jgi:hypothetical protein